jgi:Flp pilus assembly protein TadD/transglutaminase-like putative cysteine protease
MSVFFRRPSQLGLALAVLVLTLSSPLRAEETKPWSTPLAGDPKAIVAAAEMIPASDAPLVVLLDEATFVLDAQGRSTSTRHLVYRVVAEAGVDGWSTVEIPYSPWYQDKPELQARVITRDGSVHEIDPKAFGEAAMGDDADIFSDNRVLRGPLPAVGVGSIVEQLITFRDRNPFPEAGSSQRFYFGRYVPVHEARMTIEYPSTVSVKTINRTTPQLQPAKTEKDGITRLVFSSNDIPALENLEWMTPSDASQVPYVGFSSGKSWQEIARRYAEIVDKQIAGSSVKAEAMAAAGDAKAPLEIASRILASIEKDIRYAGVEYGESSIVPHPPREVLSNKYGDCKDKATLLVAMLREAGVPAHVVLLKSGTNLDVTADLPGIAEFNHAIVVTDGPKPIWIDPTDEFARAGELPLPDQGRMALIARPASTTLILTPVADSSANRIVETREFTLSEEGKARVVEINTPSGGEERNMRRTFAQADQKKYREGIETYAQNAYGAKSLGAFEAGDPHDLTKPFRLSLEAIESQRGMTEDGEAAVGIFLTGITGDLPFPLQNFQDEDPNATDAQKAKLEKKKRVRDFVFPEAYIKEWQYKIQPPPGYAPRPLPENASQKLGPATLTKEFAAKPDGSVVATFRFDTGKRRINASEFEELRKAVHELEQQKALLISFDQVGKLRLNEGDVGGALGEYRKLVELHPAEARHHVEIARALLAGGMGEAARKEIKRAIEIEPTSAKAQRMLGIIMQHDLVGRQFQKGYDLPAAVAAYKKAKELDPKDVAIRAELSDLLEYGDDGTRFSKGAKLNEAIDELLAIKKELKNDRVDGELLLLYARAGRYVELRELAKTTKDAQRKDAFRIAAVAAIDGTAAALRDSETVDQASRRGALEGAGGLMATMRLYPLAADLFSAAAQGATNASELRSRAEAMRKTKRSEDLQIADDPQGLVKKMLLAVARNDFDDDAALPFLTKEAHELYADAAKEIAESKRAGMHSVRSDDDGLSNSFMADFVLGNVQFVQDGSEELGYRVKMRSPYAGQPGPDDTVWVVREDGKYKVAATGDQLGALGVRALRLADAGKLEAARQWLDWAREIIQVRGSDDPLASPPFAHLWARGKQGTLDEVRLAAAALMPQSKKAAELALPILKAARAKAELDDTRLRIDSALAGAYGELEDWNALLEISRALAAKYPESLTAFGGQVAALTKLEKRDEVQKLANDRLKRLANDKDALRVLAADAQSHGDYDQSTAYYQKIIESSDPTSIDYNNKAWNALFTMKDIAKAIEEARQSVEMRGTNPEALHTLAALYAEEGKSSEARDSLLKSMDSSGEREPQSHDWYVFGRIAENYGVTDAAIAAYTRVEKPKQDLPGSTYILAQHRLDAIARKSGK